MSTYISIEVCVLGGKFADCIEQLLSFKTGKMFLTTIRKESPIIGINILFINLKESLYAKLFHLLNVDGEGVQEVSIDSSVTSSLMTANGILTISEVSTAVVPRVYL